MWTDYGPGAPASDPSAAAGVRFGFEEEKKENKTLRLDGLVRGMRIWRKDEADPEAAAAITAAAAAAAAADSVGGSAGASAGAAGGGAPQQLQQRHGSSTRSFLYSLE